MIDCKRAGPTLNVPEPEIEPTDAVTVELPTATAVAKPVLLTVATLAADEFQTAVPLTSCVLLSVNVPVAVNCCVIPAGTLRNRTQSCCANRQSSGAGYQGRSR